MAFPEIVIAPWSDPPGNGLAHGGCSTLLWAESDGDVAGRGLGLGYDLPVAPKALDVQSDRLPHEPLNLLDRVSNGHTPRKVWGIGREVGLAPALDHHEVSAHAPPFRVACRRMLASVPAGRSFPRLPAMVMVPGLVGWRY